MIDARLAMVVFVTAGLAGCEEETPPTPLRPVLTTTVKPITSEMFGPFASTIEARYETQLGFQTSGRMISRNVYVGDTVTTGELLAALDPTLAEFALIRAKADVADARAQLANAQGIQSRQKTLASGGNATQATLDSAVAGLATAKARLDQTLASLHVAEDQVGYTELHANFDGVITSWSAEIGQYITSGQAVVTIARPDVREAVVDIPDDAMLEVAPGMEFTVHLQASPGVQLKARVREIGPLADSVTRSHRVRLTLENPTLAFRIGTTITVEAQRDIPSKILIPTTAVVDDGNAKYVWVLTQDGGSVSRRNVTANGTEGDKTVISSGLEAGNRVVIVGVHSLHDGEAVAGTASGQTSKAESTRL